MIEDFGEKIHGAAKDRWEQYRNRLMAVPDGDLITRKLSEIFPEPNYKRLAAEGVDPWSLALIHAMRDAIPTKPTARRTASLRTWVMQVSIMRNAARMLLDGTRTREEVQASLQALDKDKLISGRLRAYELLGHDVSLKKFDIRYGAFTQIGRERFDGAQARWLFYLKSENLIAHAPELDAAIEDLQSKLNGLRAKKSGRPAWSQSTSASTTTPARLTFTISGARSEGSILLFSRLTARKRRATCLCSSSKMSWRDMRNCEKRQITAERRTMCG